MATLFRFMFIKSLCGESREKISSFCFTFEMCSRACNIRRRDLIVFYVKKLARVRSEAIKEKYWQRCFFFFFSNSYFYIVLSFASSSAG